jgi:uncharacterized protein (TIGR03435 family)
MATEQRMREVCIGMVLLATPTAWAQDAASKTLAYDVVSIKQNTSESGSMSFSIAPDGFMATNTTLHMLVANAYGFNWDLISGLPKWADSDHFNVRAKVAESDIDAFKKLPYKERQPILQKALEERFQIAVRRETKELPVYDLVIAKGDLKLRETKPGGIGGGSTVSNRGALTAKGVPVKSLLGTLAGVVHRPVIDKTGLTGVYDIELKWTPEDAPASTDETGPSIFTALQEQVGLRLDASKGMVETLIVDHAEKPSED